MMKLYGRYCLPVLIFSVLLSPKGYSKTRCNPFESSYSSAFSDKTISDTKNAFLLGAMVERGEYSPSGVNAAIPYVEQLYFSKQSDDISRARAYSLLKSIVYSLRFSLAYKTPAHQELTPLYTRILLPESIQQNQPYSFEMRASDVAAAHGYGSIEYWKHHKDSLNVVFDCLAPPISTSATEAELSQFLTEIKHAFSNRKFKKAIDTSYFLLAISDSAKSVRVSDPALMKHFETAIDQNLIEKLRFYYGVSRVLTRDADRAMKAWQGFPNGSLKTDGLYKQLSLRLHEELKEHLSNGSSSHPLFRRLGSNNANNANLSKLKIYVGNQGAKSEKALMSLRKSYDQTILAKANYGAASDEYLLRANDYLHQLDYWLFDTNNMSALRSKSTLTAKELQKINTMYQSAFQAGVYKHVRVLIADLSQLAPLKSSLGSDALALVHFNQSLAMIFNGDTRRALRLNQHLIDALNSKAELNADEKRFLYRALARSMSARQIKHLHHDESLIAIIVEHAKSVAEKRGYSLDPFESAELTWNVLAKQG